MRDIELQQILASFSPNLKKVKCNLLELCALFSSFGRICRELKNKNVFFSVFIFSSEIHFYKFNQQNHIIFKIVSCLSLDKIILFFLFLIPIKTTMSGCTFLFWFHICSISETIIYFRNLKIKSSCASIIQSITNHESIQWTDPTVFFLETTKTQYMRAFQKRQNWQWQIFKKQNVFTISQFIKKWKKHLN